MFGKKFKSLDQGGVSYVSNPKGEKRRRSAKNRPRIMVHDTLHGEVFEAHPMKIQADVESILSSEGVPPSERKDLATQLIMQATIDAPLELNDRYEAWTED